MCGIAGFHIKNPKFVKNHAAVDKLVDKLLDGIEHRGRHATGFVAVTFDGKTVMDKAAVTATEFVKDREKIPKGVQTALLHTRHATQGPKENHENNHPVLFGSCFAIHNGHINNDADLFEELGVRRTAEVDSVAIPALVDTLGFDKIGEALEKIRGNMATALIDPVKHPGTLVLARGDSSPLIIIENEHFLMWASTLKTLKEAWAEVLGTPPKDDKFETVKEGTIITVEKDKTSRSEYKVTRPFGFQRNTQKKNGNSHGACIVPSATSVKIGKPDEQNAVTKCGDEIAAYVRSNESEARRWTKKDNYDRADFMDIENPDFKRWVECYGCGDLVIKEDMRNTLHWGTICIDCHTITVGAIEREMRTMQDEEDEWCAGTLIPRIPALDRDALEGWADRELMLHNETIIEMSKRVGSYYSSDAIDFLVTHTTPEYRSTVGAAQKKLIDALREMYEETYMGVVEDHDVVVPDDRGSEDDTQAHPLLALPRGAEEVEQHSILRDSWGFCRMHNRAYPHADGCSECNAQEGDDVGIQVFEDEGGTSSPADVIQLPRCEKCNTYVLREGGICPICKQLDAEVAEVAAGQRAGATAAVEVEKLACVKCKHKGRVFLKVKGGATVGYCKKHYDKCNADGCEVDANHTLANGQRRCHAHVRGVSGALSDTTLRKRGVEIIEVGK